MQTFLLVDNLILLDVYAAGETPIEEADTQSLCQGLATLGRPATHAQDITELPSLIEQHLADGDILLMQGAGNIGEQAQRLLARWSKKAVVAATG